ncbi:hypothetical protein B5G52_05320 [Pseudoalteromonas sp. A601]|uniref:DUF3307 domain-containing protein n=1 Tax=Pseudoalteromonas sp. A601 TaxID=1967839 RepID=UPI000B3CE08A|nr:DUF3307 domain-containing protein [Pseudoalteromonas sp. A601]OUS73128.1 hypothetical protein B5G52_05320 [Pseudoalteromonas sp. A601]
MSFYLLLIGLVIAHLLADFYWQPMSWVHDRITRHFRASKLYLHVLMHSLVSALVVTLWEYHYGWGDWLNIALATVVIAITHYFIDIAKSYSNKGVLPFVLDQCAHFIVILMVAVWLADNHDFYYQLLHQLIALDSLIVLTGYLLVLNPSSVFIRMALERITNGFATSGSIPAAGHSIGILERVLMLTFILIGEYAGVGFLLAAKSIFRFGDLRASEEKQLTEYVMLGTLLSVTVTLFIGLTINFLTAQ